MKSTDSYQFRVIFCLWAPNNIDTVYPKKYAHGFCFAVLCCGYTLTDFPISIRLTSLALWQSNDCPSASKATLMNMDKYFMWIHYERLHNHNKAKHNKTVCIFLEIYCNNESNSNSATVLKIVLSYHTIAVPTLQWLYMDDNAYMLYHYPTTLLFHLQLNCAYNKWLSIGGLYT